MTSRQAAEYLIGKGLCEGTKVRVTAKTNPQDYMDTWCTDMDEWVGNEATVQRLSIDKSKVMLKNTAGVTRWFPFTSIEVLTLIQKKKTKAAKKAKLEVDEEFVKQAYDAACSDWKEKIRAQFPEVFLPKIHNFGTSYTISTISDGPLLIGLGLAPDGLEHQCLVVATDYEMETRQYDGKQILIFKKTQK